MLSSKHKLIHVSLFVICVSRNWIMIVNLALRIVLLFFALILSVLLADWFLITLVKWMRIFLFIYVRLVVCDYISSTPAMINACKVVRHAFTVVHYALQVVRYAWEVVHYAFRRLEAQYILVIPFWLIFSMLLNPIDVIPHLILLWGQTNYFSSSWFMCFF